MKKAIALIVAMLFVFAVAAVSFAAEKAKVTQVTGSIKAVDAAAKTITVVKTVKGKDVETVIAVDDKTLADLKAGEKVTVKYTTADGKNTAKSVTKAAAKAEPAKTAPAKTEPAKKPAGGY